MSSGVGKAGDGASSVVTTVTGATAVRQQQQSAAAAKAATEKSVEAAARQMQSHAQSMGRALEFRVDRTTGSTVVTVKDTTSGEVIRQIPSDEALWLAEHIGQQASVLRTQA